MRKQTASLLLTATILKHARYTFDQTPMPHVYVFVAAGLLRAAPDEPAATYGITCTPTTSPLEHLNLS